MTRTILLSQVLGIFAIIVGISMVFRRRELGEVIVTFGRDRTWRVLFSAVELLAGLFLVALHNEWDSAPAVVISLCGWMAVLESTSYLLLPDRIVEPFILAFGKPSALAASGLVALALGVYLAVYGFGAA